jgi:hypothetical protein
MLLFDSLSSRFVPKMIFMEADGAGGGGGGGGGDGDGDPGGGGGGGEKTYTEAEYKAGIEDAVKKRVAKMQRELKVRDKDAEGTKKQIEDLQTQLKELEDALEKAKGAPDEKHKGELDLLQKKFDRELESLKSQLETETAARKEAEESRKVAEGDNLLVSALKDAKCRDMKAGQRYFKPQMEWDDVENQWMLRSENGGLVKIDDGIKEEMPDYLKPSSMDGGGSGASGGAPRRRPQQAELEKLKKELVEAQQKVVQSQGSATALTAFRKIKQKVAALEKELSS